MDLSLWLPVIALLLGAVFHSLSDDGGASILDHFGISWRLPAWTLPILILLTGGATDAVQSILAGTDWQKALVTAITSVIAGVFGATAQHAIVNKTPPKLPLVLLLAGALAMTTTACPAAVSTTCQIIDAADKACTVIQVPGPDGGVVSVQVTREELQKFASERQAAHAHDGGAP